MLLLFGSCAEKSYVKIVDNKVEKYIKVTNVKKRVRDDGFLEVQIDGENVTKIDMNNDTGEQVIGLDYRDFNQAAAEAIQSMLRSPALDKQGGRRYVLAISNVKNDTMQHIDRDQLIKKIRIELLNSGKVYVTTAVGTSTDKMNQKSRDLRENDEFKKSSVASKGTLQAPDLSLPGKILQRNVSMGKDKQQVEYYFMLTLTDLQNGFSVWKGESIIGKGGSSKNVAW